MVGPLPDLISRGTAWLYLKFATGTLTGYDYAGPNSKISAGALQAAIWSLKGEGANPNNLFSLAVTNQFGNAMAATAAMADNNGTYSVGVLNLWGAINHTEFAQDQLMLTGSPNLLTGVPNGGSTAMLLGLGFLSDSIR